MRAKNNMTSRESRSELRGKRRKTNFILNALIGLVILLIIIVSATIFLGGNAEETSENQLGKSVTEQDNQESKTKSAPKKAEHDEKVVEAGSTKVDLENKKGESSETDKGSDSQPEQEERTFDSEEGKVVTPGGEQDDVANTIINPNWEPIGTSQTGEHTSVYDLDSVDWKEMLQAISYATGLTQDNMTIWFLGNNGHNKSVGTIMSKDQQEKYRIYLEWIDGQGWKPTKLEELKEIE